ncbi:DUF4232 domain-containing protein [Streptomyces griseosporeus]|uniref:DUF4232 domain-containing protein n=1 Tax=Streptomyces griseosporeus TaxID=1910 RepID=UPI00167C8BF3|nr:DUF4232 domain-containing protein [Streptomyces griseosporeus]GHF64463.1 hypothetical protein GCM10018783_37430 [Streptomyces griseosporeus]
MRTQKLSLIALTAAAALSLAACQGSDDDSAAPAASSSGSTQTTPSEGGGGSGDGKTSAAPSEGAGGGSGGTGAGSGSGSGSGSGGRCRTADLDFTATHGMGEGILTVHLKNTGSATCTLKGFPGVDLKGKDGTVSATRSDVAPVAVEVKPGEETRFTLRYPPNTSGGSGTTFTTLVVTPPNETHSHTLPTDISVPVTEGSGQPVTVDPVGTGK